MLKPRFIILFIIVLLVAATRLLPHPPNFTPIAALALFGGAFFADKRMAYIVALGAMFLSDVFLGFHNTMPFVYAAFIITIFMGTKMRGKVSAKNVLGGALGSSILFFVLTNFGVWMVSAYYPLTLEGLITCYVAAIPFFHYTLAGTLVYSAVLFGGFEFAQRRVPSLQVNS